MGTYSKKLHWKNITWNISSQSPQSTVIYNYLQLTIK